MATAACAIWKMPAELLEKAGEFEVFDSPRAGGKYWISGSAIGEVLPLNDRAKRLLTTWLCEQRRAGVEIPRIQTGVLGLIAVRRELPVSARLATALAFFGRTIPRLGMWLMLGEQLDSDTLKFFAETESQDIGELSELLHMLKDSGLLDGTQYLSGGARLRPTAAGWTEIERLSRPQADSTQAFVAMWFNESLDDAYFNGIAPAVAATGYKSLRLDQKEHNNKIDDEIIAEIRRSRFLVADFTCEAGRASGGVYYEAGFAQGIGIPVIWTCRATSISDLHFDTRQYAHIAWEDPADLFFQLKNRIGATIGDGPLLKG